MTDPLREAAQAIRRVRLNPELTAELLDLLMHDFTDCMQIDGRDVPGEITAQAARLMEAVLGMDERVYQLELEAR